MSNTTEISLIQHNDKKVHITIKQKEYEISLVFLMSDSKRYLAELVKDDDYKKERYPF